MSKITDLPKKTVRTMKEGGIKKVGKYTKNYLIYHFKEAIGKNKRAYKDILFIYDYSDECPHPKRYRVDHQVEQLEAYGMSCDKVFYGDLNLDMIKYYRGFVFCRCPILPVMKEFIKLAKENNKTTFFDIDDLMFDTKYTNQIKYLETMSKSEKALYDDGVIRMGQTMKLCEYGITTTERLQTEMSKTLKEVYINRNVASEQMVKYSQRALHEKRDKDKIIMGYFSGSITHNDDFKMITPAVVKLLKKYDNLYLQIVGPLDIPKEMEPVRNKILTHEFISWQELPSLVHSVDINLAPLEDSIFNEAKSENKWTEAALVKVPTVASDVGAFKNKIKNNKTGLLCQNNTKAWTEGLIRLVEDKEYRQELADNAYKVAMSQYITTYTGKGIADFIKSKLHKNILFVLPSTNISGGVMVTLKHASVLQKHGYDVTMLNVDKDTTNIKNRDGNLFVVSLKNTKILAHVEMAVATLWSTLDEIFKFKKCSRIKYLVQNFETDFYQYGYKERGFANATYNQVEGVEYITISKWCEDWLKNKYGNEVKCIANGIDSEKFPTRKRNFEGKVKILIEGNCGDYYKNVDESFKIADKLDKDKFEIVYLFYESQPKKTYIYDEAHRKVPHDKVGQIYKKCDILLKSSILESFSYPPLEMMATGGFCVVAPNEGNVEYLKDQENCLFYQLGDIDDAVEKINLIAKDGKLREKLLKNYPQLITKREWKNLEKDIIKLYE